MKPTVRPIALLLAAALAGPVAAAEAERPAGPWWPQFHGPGRRNVSPDTGLLQAWPKGGPKLLWKFTECGSGYAGVSLADGRIYTSGDFGRQEAVLALDPAGRLLWKSPNGQAWKGPYPGARTTPTYDNGVLYHMGPNGRLAAFRAADGREIWAVDIARRYQVKPSRWAFAENILVDGDVLYCAPGGTGGRVVCLRKADGKVVWANTDIPDGAAYCSPILVEYGGTRQLVSILQKAVVGVDVKTGKLLWRHEHVTKHDQNVTHPLYHDGTLFASSGHGTGGRKLRLAADGKSVTELWLNKDLDNCHGGTLLLDGCVYGHGCRLFRKGFVCVDYQTGKTLWNEPKFPKLSLTFADGRLYGITDKAKVVLLRVDRSGCEVVGQFSLPPGPRGLTLSHPVVCGGVLYVRHWNTLYAYDVRGSAGR